MANRQDVWDVSVPVEKSAYFSKNAPKISRNSSPRLPGPGVVDLFSGCGGISVGFERAGFSTVLGIDVHRPSSDTYRKNFPHAATIFGDIRQVSSSDVSDLVKDCQVSIVTAGVPCQGFSLSNRKRHAADERNFLFLEFIRIVEALNPPFVLLENVSGMRSTAGGQFVEDIKAAIAELGYRVDSRMLNAAEFGVPQMRRRLFFIGAKPPFKILWPKPQFGPGLKPFRTVKDAIGDLPPLGNAEFCTEYSQKPFSEFQTLMRGSEKVLKNHEAPSHPPETIKKIGSTLPGEPMYPKFAQRIRLHPDKPSPTQVSGGIRPQFSFGHPTQPRGLSIRERCRIQSFPDWFEVLGGIVQGRVQTGNAVPPLLAQAVAGGIALSLKKQSSELYEDASAEQLRLVEA